MLVCIKLLHSLVWAVFAGSILGIPICALQGRFSIAKKLSILVWGECAVLGLNGGCCPLTDFAARYTTHREANFDIYLPLWLAENNKVIFGSLFLAGEIIYLILWIRERRSTPSA